jgi:hypothetical protein
MAVQYFILVLQQKFYAKQHKGIRTQKMFIDLLQRQKGTKKIDYAAIFLKLQKMKF